MEPSSTNPPLSPMGAKIVAAAEAVKDLTVHWTKTDLAAIRAQIDRLRIGGADSRADKRKRVKPLVPRNPDVAKLARKIKRDLPKGGTEKDVAIDFTNGDEQKANNLLRQLRRFPHLLE